MEEKSKKEKIEERVNDLNKSHDGQKSQEEILVDQLCEGIETYEHHKVKVFLGAITAGLELGFSYLVIGIIYTLFQGKINETYTPFVAAFAYPLGFIIVVLGKSILFTEQTSLLALPVLHKKRSVSELLGLWGIVITGNLIGGMFMAVIIGYIGTAMGIITVDAIASIATHVSKAAVPVIFGSAVLAGWLMALLSWLVSSSMETISRIVVIYMITLIVGFSGLHHSIVGNIEVFAGLFFTDAISTNTYLTFQLTALFGNAFGGVIFVALLRYRAFTANF
ncbi:Formate/nitrite transporter family [Croceitalea dokdonensis DOKDO 023]|uniref:Formate/nitrite transporter family n=1 Tax=Croceitalea dokdonensis DOKDO 023 TaxID=1300341 RepID=A0A0P7AVY9_9FLAO|nr:formate/nitrite transporter family protein [Croceitalea dokdonensis]KPM32166.1 Formate/nitrite transporter family [Croceitalea dokdonensis DOKDO 023]